MLADAKRADLFAKSSRDELRLTRLLHVKPVQIWESKVTSIFEKWLAHFVLVESTAFVMPPDTARTSESSVRPPDWHINLPTTLFALKACLSKDI